MVSSSSIIAAIACAAELQFAGTTLPPVNRAAIDSLMPAGNFQLESTYTSGSSIDPITGLGEKQGALFRLVGNGASSLPHLPDSLKLGRGSAQTANGLLMPSRYSFAPPEIIQIPLKSFVDRPAGAKVNVLLVHSMCAPEFADSLSIESCLATLRKADKSTHYLIGRDGTLIQCVDECMAAAHAGKSRMPFRDDHRRRVNDFSIGIELICGRDMSYTLEQYQTLAYIVDDISKRHPISSILGHQHVAWPRGRKADPGEQFEWAMFKDFLAALGMDLSKVRTPQTK